MQLSLFEKSVLEGVKKHGTTSGTYAHVRQSLGLTEADMTEVVQAGAWGPTKKWPRKIRYLQQTLKAAGLIESGSSRGTWQTTDKGESALTKAPSSGLQIVFFTNFGVALWGDGKELSKHFRGEVEMIMTSPPYLLSKDRSYGNWGRTEKEYVRNVVENVEAWLPMLTNSGSLVLNLGESTIPGTGQQSLSNERILIQLEDELGLHLIQKFIWENPVKQPTGYWVTRERKRCVFSTENLFWLSLNPKSTKADNRRVLKPYSASQEKLMAKLADSDVSRKCRPSGLTSLDKTFYADNGGAIPRNVLRIAHEGANSQYSRECKDHNLPRHPAMFPSELAEFFVKFVTEEQDMVADPCSGSFKLGEAAEKHSRYWAGSELFLENILGGGLRFKQKKVAITTPE